VAPRAESVSTNIVSDEVPESALTEPRASPEDRTASAMFRSSWSRADPSG
jgi:hypothetical protein